MSIDICVVYNTVLEAVVGIFTCYALAEAFVIQQVEDDEDGDIDFDDYLIYRPPLNEGYIIGLDEEHVVD